MRHLSKGGPEAGIGTAFGPDRAVAFEGSRSAALVKCNHSAAGGWSALWSPSTQRTLQPSRY